MDSKGNAYLSYLQTIGIDYMQCEGVLLHQNILNGSKVIKNNM